MGKKHGLCLVVSYFLDYYYRHNGQGGYGQNELGRAEVFRYLAQQGTAIFEQVVHVLGFALEHVYRRFEGAGDVFGHYFFDLLKLVGHRKEKFKG